MHTCSEQTSPSSNRTDRLTMKFPCVFGSHFSSVLDRICAFGKAHIRSRYFTVADTCQSPWPIKRHELVIKRQSLSSVMTYQASRPIKRHDLSSVIAYQAPWPIKRHNLSSVKAYKASCPIERHDLSSVMTYQAPSVMSYQASRPIKRHDLSRAKRHDLSSVMTYQVS